MLWERAFLEDDMAHLNFAWDHSAPNNLEYRLYEDGAMIQDNIAVLNFSLLMDSKPYNTYSYHVTAVDLTTGLESAPSGSVTVNFTIPAAPTGLSASFAG